VFERIGDVKERTRLALVLKAVLVTEAGWPLKLKKGLNVFGLHVASPALLVTSEKQ